MSPVSPSLSIPSLSHLLSHVDPSLFSSCPIIRWERSGLDNERQICANNTKIRGCEREKERKKRTKVRGRSWLLKDVNRESPRLIFDLSSLAISSSFVSFTVNDTILEEWVNGNNVSDNQLKLSCNLVIFVLLPNLFVIVFLVSTMCTVFPLSQLSLDAVNEP